MVSEPNGMKRRIVPLLLTIGAVLAGCANLRPIEPPPYARLSGGVTTGPLTLRSVALTFSNERGEITVPRDSRPTAHATIRFNGNGLFRANWVVDDYTVETVSLTVTYGNTLELDTAPATVLPTLEPGRHLVTLHIDNPVPPFDLPVITYTVTANGRDTGTEMQ